MPSLAEFSTLATPVYRTLLVRDADADADIDGGATMLRANRDVVASNGYQLYLGSLQESGKVSVRLQVWDGPRSAELTDWSGQVDARLTLNTGLVIVEEITSGPAAEWRLPTGAGEYAVRAYFRHREEKADRVSRIYQEASAGGWTTGRVMESLNEVDGLEEYLLYLWRVE